MIPYPQGPHNPADEVSFWRSLVFALPRTYAVVFYSTEARLGWFLLALNLLVPAVGLAGLAGIVCAAAAAWVLGLDRGMIRSGFYLFNPLLACSSLAVVGWSRGWSLPTLAVLLVTASVAALFLTSGLQGWGASRMGISVQSLPAVLVVVLLQHAGHASAPPHGLGPIQAWAAWNLHVLPDFLRGFLRSFAAMAFQASDFPGLLAFLAFFLSSPLGGIMAVAGYLGGTAALHLMGWPTGADGVYWCGFNFLLAGIAFGAGYHVPNRTSLAMAGAGGALTAVVAVALADLLGRLSLSPGALPYNLVVLAIIASLRLAARPSSLMVSPWTTLQPEGTARLAQIHRLRFPDFHKPALFLPCAGETIVTQSFDGTITHRGAWRHAIDFEGPGKAGSWDPGNGRLEDFAIYGREVHAPVTGTVVTVENHVPDNPVGQNNLQANWGNHVVIRADNGLHALLAHFAKDSIRVTVGQRVLSGALLGVCGNSGRSPVPHLHVNMQTAPQAGAPTLPFVLKHYVEARRGETPPTYRLSGVPEKGTVLRPTNPSADLHASFSGWLPGLYRYQVSGREERVRVELDERGCFRLGSSLHGEQLTLFLAEGVLYADAFDGGPQGLLSLLAVVLARVPCLDDPDVVWHDFVAAAPFLSGRRRWFHNLFDPFRQVAVLPYRYTLRRERESFILTAELQPTRWRDPSIPSNLVAEIHGRQGVCSLRGQRTGGAAIEASLVQEE